MKIFWAIILFYSFNSFGSFEGGFYHVVSPELQQYTDEVIHLHPELYVQKSKKGGKHLLRGYRAIFKKYGALWMESNKKLEKIHLWKDRRLKVDRRSPWQSLGPEQMKHSGVAKLEDRTDGIYLSFYNFRNIRLASSKLIYLGKNQFDLNRYFQSRGVFPNKVKTIYLSHRGTARLDISNENGIFPGNTLAAFEHALLQGYEGFEMDVRLSRDGKLMVFHDEKINVTTKCKGKLSQMKSTEIKECLARRSGLIPESRFSSTLAKWNYPLMTLKEIMLHFIARSKVKQIVIDVKPGDYLQIAENLNEIFGLLNHDEKKKISILYQSQELRSLVDCLECSFALESSNGWGPLNEPMRGEYFLRDVEDKENYHDSISLGIGLGLALNGLGRNIPQSIEPIYRILSKVPSTLWHLNLDVQTMNWGAKNLKKFISFMHEAQERKMPIIAWTVNGRRKIHTLRKKAPHLDYVLSDSPYSTIARVQLLEFLEIKQKAY